MPDSERRPPITIKMHENDNVAIVGNDGGLSAGTVLPSGLTLREHVPQSHKIALLHHRARFPSDIPRPPLVGRPH